MKKKIALILILIAMTLCLTGCYNESPMVSTFENNDDNSYFITIQDCGYCKIDGYSIHLYKVYAKDTHVKYMFGASHYRSVITPLYNADGTLQIWEGE